MTIEDKKIESGYRVPDGYFDDITGRILSQLPKKEDSPTPSNWKRIQPYLYMAAMFVGIALIIETFVGLTSPSSSPSTLAKTSVSEQVFDDYLIAGNIDTYEVYQYLINNNDE